MSGGAVLLDTHVVHWWSAEPHRVSSRASAALESASQLVVAAVSWYELAWLADNGRIAVDLPIRAWLAELATQVRTIGITPGVAATAAALPSTFPRDPADRLIFATAVEHGLELVSKDRAIREYRHPRPIAVW